jgi:hypothetical protein
MNWDLILQIFGTLALLLYVIWLIVMAGTP